MKLYYCIVWSVELWSVQLACRCTCNGQNCVGKKFGAMHFIYYINRSIATKVDLTYLGY